MAKIRSLGYRCAFTIKHGVLGDVFVEKHRCAKNEKNQQKRTEQHEKIGKN